MTLDPGILDQIAAAQELAKQARAAAVAGDREQARELRAQYDSLWEAIEAQAAVLCADSHKRAPVGAGGYTNNETQGESYIFYD